MIIPQAHDQNDTPVQSLADVGQTKVLGGDLLVPECSILHLAEAQCDHVARDTPEV